jgi:RNA polymerase sigma factor (sigma-70 family)
MAVASSDALGDAELVGRVRDGDERAFEALYARHSKDVRLAVSDHVRDREEQLDVVQETFLRAFARLHELRDPERFRPWLLQIARRCAIDARRHNARRPCDPSDESDDVRSGEPSPSDLAEVRDLADRLRAAVAVLSPRDATALTLAVELGLGPSELAVALGVTTNHAKVILHRSRRRLRAAAELEQALGSLERA